MQNKVLNILVADDNPMSMRAMILLLKRLGHTGIAVDNGEKALKCLEENIFDVLLLDDRMPVMDGPTTMAKIREQEADGRRKLKSIICTSNDLPSDRQRYITAGADGYLAKPVTIDSLTQELALLSEK
jgi:CheY-like chemotaxis protein